MLPRNRTPLCAVLALAAGCTPTPAAKTARPSALSPLEGTHEYVGDGKGQSILVGGHYIFFRGPANGSGPMGASAGTYQISGDTASHNVRYSTHPNEVGTVFRWRSERWDGDTLTYVTIGTAGEVLTRGRGVKRP